MLKGGKSNSFSIHPLLTLINKWAPIHLLPAATSRPAPELRPGELALELRPPACPPRGARAGAPPGLGSSRRISARPAGRRGGEPEQGGVADSGAQGGGDARSPAGPALTRWRAGGGAWRARRRAWQGGAGGTHGGERRSREEGRVGPNGDREVM